MKLYDFSLAPAPKRVRMFLAEKAIEIPLVEVNTSELKQFTESFKARNPDFTIPVLELDDGTCISESVAICRYFEELEPEPSLFGTDPVMRAVTNMWNRRVEIQGYANVVNVVRNTAQMFEDRATAGVESGVPQIPELAERGRKAMQRFSHMLDEHLAGSPFIVGQNFSIVDITAYVTWEFAKRGDITIPADCTNVRRWFDDITARPSASA